MDSSNRCSVQYPWNAQREFRDDPLELRSVLRRHLERPAHRADRCIELTTARVFKSLSRSKKRLLADHAEAPHLLNARIAVGNDPVPGNQLRRNRSHILDGDRIGENVALQIRIGLVGNELRIGLDRDLIFLALCHGVFNSGRLRGSALHTKASEVASKAISAEK